MRDCKFADLIQQPFRPADSDVEGASVAFTDNLREAVCERRGARPGRDGDELDAALGGQRLQPLDIRKDPTGRVEVKQANAVKPVGLRIQQPGDERRDADASGDPYFPACPVCAQKAPVRRVDVGVHADLHVVHEHSGKVSQGANDEANPPARGGRCCDGERMRFAQTIGFHAQEAEMTG